MSFIEHSGWSPRS